MEWLLGFIFIKNTNFIKLTLLYHKLTHSLFLLRKPEDSNEQKYSLQEPLVAGISCFVLHFVYYTLCFILNRKKNVFPLLGLRSLERASGESDLCLTCIYITYLCFSYETFGGAFCRHHLCIFEKLSFKRHELSVFYDIRIIARNIEISREKNKQKYMKLIFFQGMYFFFFFIDNMMVFITSLGKILITTKH